MALGMVLVAIKVSTSSDGSTKGTMGTVQVGFTLWILLSLIHKIKISSVGPSEIQNDERKAITSLGIIDLDSKAFQVDALPSWMVTLHVNGKAAIGEDFPARGTLVLDGRQVLLPHVAADVPLVLGALAAQQAHKTQVALPHLFGHQDPQLILSAIYKQNNSEP